MEWVFDSAFRFFPVQPDPEMGYVLDFWDAATNKVLALAGRGELRDYLDVLQLHRRHLTLGALAWAACGKDIGYTPQFILEDHPVRHAYHHLAAIRAVLKSATATIFQSGPTVPTIASARYLTPSMYHTTICPVAVLRQTCLSWDVYTPGLEWPSCPVVE